MDWPSGEHLLVGTVGMGRPCPLDLWYNGGGWCSLLRNEVHSTQPSSSSLVTCMSACYYVSLWYVLEESALDAPDVAVTERPA